ncbi:hypothetical protein LIER_19427 [Lithospermum erythrorhizon]|uniref:Protein kinase domain-containing protein n=1 Tax=Lithospermum erythrorhizon TaxID=34254 RepID=A0AAV3QHS1_LITER
MTKSKSSQTTDLCCQFSLSEIKLATQDFNEEFIIGRGGFGEVYKGFINEGIVAIKRLCSASKQGEVEFWMEIETLSKLRHVHLVSLIGYCNESDEMILVYEYMPKGTIVDHLYRLNGSYSPLDWETRLKICIGAARGLDYLHTGTVPGIIHRDVKDSNILLDDQFVAKISDFGLAKLESITLAQSYVSTNVKGTFGYLDPEYFLTRRLSKKTDVYAFGVVLLVVLCGRPAVDMRVVEYQQSLTLWAQECIRDGRVDQIIDPNLLGKIAVKSLEAFLKVTKTCLDKKPKKRPNMSQIVANLEFALEQQLLRPGNSGADKVMLNRRFQFFLQKGDEEENESSSLTTIGGKSFHQEHLSGIPIWRTCISDTKWAWSWLWGCFVNRKEASVNPQNDYDVSLPMSQTDTHIRSILPMRGVLSEANFRIFSISHLKQATKNFSSDSYLGDGGFGKIYKGCLHETGFIAIKILNREHSIQGLDEWQAEVNIQGALSHPNLVKLFGLCQNDTELLLVYEYMAKGSLYNYLFCCGRSVVKPLSWEIRVKILIGAARSLAFLHSSDKNIVFRDLKTSNILLDENFNAKLSGFGLAKLSPSADESHAMSRVMGTFGYIDPEYYRTGQFNVKCDVYAFGVVMVEMLTGLRAMDTKRPDGQQNLIHWIKPHLSTNKNLEPMMDSRLNCRYPPEAALIVAQTALTCLEDEPKRRPSMEEVLKTLEAVTDLSLSTATASSLDLDAR